MTNQEERVRLSIEGMHCTSCAQGIEKHLRSIGIPEASINFATGIATIPLKNSNELPSVLKEIEKLGYTASREGEAPISPSNASPIEIKLLISILFTLPLLLHMVVPIPFMHQPFVQLVLSIPVVVIGVLHFGPSAFHSAYNRAANMDVLIVIGIVSSFLYSLAGMMLGLGDNYLFFETAATITTFVLLGNVIERRAVKSTTSAVEELTKLQITTAKKVISRNGVDEVIDVDSRSVETNDVLIINTGDRVPADGTVIWGSCDIDESMITGESAPVHKEIGSSVIGGTVISRGAARMKATAVGEASVLAYIVRLVEETQERKPAIQQLGDKVSSIFVPVVLIIAAITFLGSLLFGVTLGVSLLRAVAVLVVACPCAMGLATPTAVMVGLGRGARLGILIKGGSSIEHLSKVGTVAFDKTGTLTTGKFTVTSLQAIDRPEEQVRSLIVGLELHSSHPIAKSLVEALSGSTPAVLGDIAEERGKGISGRNDAGSTISLGSAAMLPEAARARPGHTLYLAEGETLIGVIDLSDEYNSGAHEVIQTVKELGIHPVLISGDTREKCVEAATSLGIDEFYAEQSPEQKLHRVAELAAKTRTAFVGDGINDAPALSAAQVGISLSDATHVAVQSAQVVLLRRDLQLVGTAILLARQTYRTIKQNLFWAFFYNSLAIPIAAFGYLSPMVAALSMLFSDVIVIGNSILLKKKRIA